MFVDQVKVYVKAATAVTEWLRSAVKNTCRKAVLPAVTEAMEATSF